MGKATRRNLLAHKLRLGLTVLAIALGVALVAGTLTLTGAMTAARAGPPAADQPDLVVRGPALDALSGRSPERQAPRQPLEEAVAGRVAGVDGVAAVRGVVHRPVTLLGAGGAPVAAAGEPTLGVSLSQADGLEPQASLAEGRLPGGGEAVLDATSARALDLAIGGRVEVVGADGRAQAFTISGIVGAAGRGGELAGRVAGFDLPTAQRLLGRAGQLDEVQVAAAPGSDPEALRRRVAAALRRGPEVDTGAAVERQQRAERDREVRSVRQTMLWFVLVALLIGGFLVANAFSIMVAQRTRELALLRCLGATTGQVRNAVLLEALVVGVAASLLGTLAGPLVAAALARQLSRLGGGAAPGAGLGALLGGLSPVALGAPVVVGVLVTVASALLPARKATAAPPLVAMRDEGLGMAVERVGRLRVVAGVGLVAAAAVASLAAAVLPGRWAARIDVLRAVTSE